MDELTITANRSDAPKPRHAKLEGRDYLVVPVVALVEGVFNGALHPLSAIKESAPAWNGVPVVVHHPKQDGAAISANSPEVLEKSSIGRFFNVNVDGSALKGELWIDVAKAKRLGGDALKALQWLEAGKPLEVSTGFFSRQSSDAGRFGDRDYSGVRTNMLPDHIAVLPGEKGACSWGDGCGAPRVNEDSLFERIRSAIVEGFRGIKPPAPQVNEKEKSMDKKDIVDGLIANEATRFEEKDREWLMTLEADRLQTLCPVEVKQGDDKPAPKANDDGKPNPKTLEDRVAALEDEEIRDMLQRNLAAQKSKKADLVKRLVENKQCKLSEATLKALSIEELEQLDGTLRPNEYVRRAPKMNDGTRVNERGYVPMPPVMLAKDNGSKDGSKKDAA